MNEYTIFSDPGCGLSQEEVQSLNVTVLPYTINIGKESYITTTAWDNFSEAELFSMVRKDAPSFSRPPLGDWFEIIEDRFKSDFDVLYIGMTQKITGSMNSLSVIYKSLAEKYPERKLILIDSLTVGRGTGYYVRKAVENIGKGFDIEENAKSIEDILNSTRSFWIPKKSLLFKITNRGDSSSLTNTSRFTILKTTEDGQFIPDQTYKSLNEALEYMSDFDGQIELSFTGDFSKRKALPIIEKFNHPRVYYSTSPFTSTVCGPESIEVLVINE